MFDHKHYVPILKTKAGERWAIDHLPGHAADRITPLFEIHRHKSKDNTDHITEVCESLSSVWGTDRLMFLDTQWLHDPNGDSALIEWTFQKAREMGLQAVPVARVTYDEATANVMTDITNEDGHGLVLRLNHDDVGSTPAINSFIELVDLSRSKVDLLVDYRTHAMNLAIDLPKLANIGEWRTLIASSGAFPRGLAHLQLNTWQSIQRYDWQSWLSAVTGSLPRKPIFGDYTTRDPGPPAEGGAPSVHLRYTQSDHWMVRVGGKFQQGHAGDIYQICQTLVASGNFSGANFSAGDDEINLRAQNGASTGAPQQWVQWGINHHLMFVVNQLAGAAI
jgi:hypothetical protein